MCKRTMQFRSEHKISIHCERLARPHLRQLRLDVPIKRRINLHQIEALRQIFQRMFPSTLHPRRIKHPFPILIRPPSSTDTDLRRYFHEGNCRLAQAEFVRRDESTSVVLASASGRADLSRVGRLVRARLQRWIVWEGHDFSRAVWSKDRSALAAGVKLVRAMHNGINKKPPRSNTHRRDS